MSLFLQLVLGGVMIGLTVMIHAVSLDFVIRHAGRTETFIRRLKWKFWQPLMAGIIVVAVFLVHILHIWLWTLLYLALDCPPLSGFSDALYFSTITYTTLGYGDIILDPAFRMLSGIEATNGFLLFGWTTAFIFEVISQLYRREAESL